MTSITNTSQLNTFSMVRSVILANTAISAKFKTSDFYEFEPKHKSAGFGGFPYIIISVPDTEKGEGYIGDLLDEKKFDIDITMRMDYLARDNFTTYASNILKELENSNSTFQASGYYLDEVIFSGSEIVIINQKELVQGTFTLTLRGEV